MSGGRATVAGKQGRTLSRHAGDIVATAPLGHQLTDRFYLEAKHYRSLDLESFFLAGKGKLAGFWRVALKEARRHNKEPLLLVRQNRVPDLVVARKGALRKTVAVDVPGMVIQGFQKDLGKYEVRKLADVLSVKFVVRSS